MVFGHVLVVVAFAAVSYGAPKLGNTYALRVGIDDGRTAVRAGDRITYVTKISNTGPVATPALLLSQTLPPGLTLVSSSPPGVLSHGRVLWNETLPAGRTDRFEVTADVGILSGVTRLAAVACASTKADRRPILCASHIDRLRTDEAQGGTGGPIPDRILWYGAGAVGGLLILLGLMIQRRRAQAGR